MWGCKLPIYICCNFCFIGIKTFLPLSLFLVRWNQHFKGLVCRLDLTEHFMAYCGNNVRFYYFYFEGCFRQCRDPSIYPWYSLKFFLFSEMFLIVQFISCAKHHCRVFICFSFLRPILFPLQLMTSIGIWQLWESILTILSKERQMVRYLRTFRRWTDMTAGF